MNPDVFKLVFENNEIIDVISLTRQEIISMFRNAEELRKLIRQGKTNEEIINVQIGKEI